MSYVLQNRGGAGPPKSVTSEKDCTTAYSENIMSLRTGESEPSPTKVTSIHHGKNTYLRRKVQPWADHPCRESSHGKYGWLPQLPQWISVAVASLWLGISCVYYLQLLPCRYWTQWSPNVMILCRQGHASLYLLPAILCSPHSLTRDWTHAIHGWLFRSHITHGWQSSEEDDFYVLCTYLTFF